MSAREGGLERARGVVLKGRLRSVGRKLVRSACRDSILAVVVLLVAKDVVVFRRVRVQLCVFRKWLMVVLVECDKWPFVTMRSCSVDGWLYPFRVVAVFPGYVYLVAVTVAKLLEISRYGQMVV